MASPDRAAAKGPLKGAGGRRRWRLPRRHLRREAAGAREASRHKGAALGGEAARATTAVAARDAGEACGTAHLIRRPADAVLLLLLWSIFAATQERPDGADAVEQQIRGVGDAIAERARGALLPEVVDGVRHGIAHEAGDLVHHALRALLCRLLLGGRLKVAEALYPLLHGLLVHLRVHSGLCHAARQRSASGLAANLDLVTLQAHLYGQLRRLRQLLEDGQGLGAATHVLPELGRVFAQVAEREARLHGHGPVVASDAAHEVLRDLRDIVRKPPRVLDNFLEEPAGCRLLVLRGDLVEVVPIHRRRQQSPRGARRLGAASC
mmetsp:Transcript_115196/g.366091  ORF Transcript_115196/g.366091 Transcript_115196/m.366091 type:complete len:322 (+) Transcript_115196:736-1701(+)